MKSDSSRFFLCPKLLKTYIQCELYPYLSNKLFSILSTIYTPNKNQFKIKYIFNEYFILYIRFFYIFVLKLNSNKKMSFTTTILIALGITAVIWSIFYLYDATLSQSSSKSKIYESPFKRPIKEDNRVHISPENHLKSIGDIIGKTQVSEPVLSTEVNDILPIDNQELVGESISFLAQAEENEHENINDTNYENSFEEEVFSMNDEIPLEENSLEMEENEVDIALRTMESILNYEDNEYYQFRTASSPLEPLEDSISS